MCKLARQDEKVKNVITNNGHITCFLKEMRGERNTTCRLEKPEDLARLTGKPLGEILKQLDLNYIKYDIPEEEERTKPNSVDLFCVNACGLKSKLDLFDHNILKNNILIFTESKTDKTCETVISKYFDEHDFITFFKHRKTLNIHKSGGITICIKRIYINVVKLSQQNVHMSSGAN